MRTKSRIMLLVAAIALLIAVVPVGAVANSGPAIDPDSVEVVLFPGQSTDIDKDVTLPDAAPKLDVCFIIDVSGSFWGGGWAGGFQGQASAIWDGLAAATSDLQMGLASFADFPIGPWGAPGDHAYALEQDLTATKATWTGAVAALPALSGNDIPESQYEALYQMATGEGNDVLPAGASPADIAADQDCTWRNGAVRVVVLATDAPFHLPTDVGLIAYPGHSEADTIAALQAAGIKVVGLKTPAAGSELDAVAAATGGVSLTLPDPGTLTRAIVFAGIPEVDVEVSMTSDCEWPVSTSFDPTSETAEFGDLVEFVETIEVAADAPGGTYVCNDWVLIDGEPMRDGRGQIIYETKTVKVPEGFLTGGGQIGKGSKGQQFGGNVGYLADFTIVGQWQFSDGASKLKMHSTGWTSLQFSVEGAPDSPPPDANADVALFSGTARVKVGKGVWDDSCTFTAQAKDFGEPGKGVDVFGISIECTDEYTGGPFVFGRETIDAGNLQIHSGVKG